MKVTSTDIKNSFGKYLRLCTTEPVYITKNGEVIAKLVNHSEHANMGKSIINNAEMPDWDFETHKSYDSEHVTEAMSKYNQNRVRLDYDEFTRMNQDTGNRYEYIYGEVYLLSSPTVYHQRVVSRLHNELSRYLEGKPCDVFASPFDVTLVTGKTNESPSIVQPDLLIACNWRENVNESGKYIGIPTLLIEVLSPGTAEKDTFTKLNLYKDSGIKEYWIVDPVMGNAIIYRFEDNAIAETRIFSSENLCESMIYPGLTFRVRE